MNVLTIQQRIAKVAGEQPAARFTSLNHYLDMNWMKAAYHRLRKDSAGQEWMGKPSPAIDSCKSSEMK